MQTTTDLAALNYVPRPYHRNDTVFVTPCATFTTLAALMTFCQPTKLYRMQDVFDVRLVSEKPHLFRDIREHQQRRTNTDVNTETSTQTKHRPKRRENKSTHKQRYMQRKILTLEIPLTTLAIQTIFTTLATLQTF